MHRQAAANYSVEECISLSPDGQKLVIQQRQYRNGRTFSKRQQLPHSAFGETKEQYGVPLRDASSTLLSLVSGLHLIARLLEVHIGFPRNLSLGHLDLGAGRPPATASEFCAKGNSNGSL